MAGNEKIIVELILKDKDFQKGIKDAVKDTQKLGKEGGDSTSKLASGFKAVAAAAATVQVGRLLLDLSKTAAEVQGVKSAFKNSFDASVLNDMRRAVNGTVDDLSLMQKALNAKNLRIPIDTLNAGLKLAKQRAAETGESVEYLSQSVVLGLGRESALILDNLGISAKRLSEETAKTGDFMKAAADIINEELKNAPQTITELADSMAQLNAQSKNYKDELAERLTPAFQAFFKTMVDSIDFIDKYIEKQKEYAKWQREEALGVNKLRVEYKNNITTYDTLVRRINIVRDALNQENAQVVLGTKTYLDYKNQLKALTIVISEIQKQKNKEYEENKKLNNQTDKTAGAIELLTQKIATQKELITVAAEKDLPALNFQLQVMEEEMKRLQSLGKIELPQFDTKGVTPIGIQANLEPSNRDPVIPPGLEEAYQKIINGNTVLIDQFTILDHTLMGFAETFTDGVIDAFAEAIINGEDFGDSMKKMIQSLIIEISKLAVKMAVLNLLFPGAGAAAAGGLGSVLRFASGTNYAPGGLALVGEYGPELVNLPKGSSVYSSSKTSGMMGSNELYGRLRGQDLLISNNRTRTFNAR